MSSDYKDKSGHNHRRALRFLTYAIKGIQTAFISERNMKIHVIIGITVIFIAAILSVTTLEWIILLIIIFGMITLEMVNTAIERVVDLVTKEYHPLAKQAKDISAGAVLVYAILAVLIGLIIFIPKFILIVKVILN